MPPALPAGQRVAVRGGHWRVTASVDHADCRELHLQAADGTTSVLLWPFDRPRPLEGRRTLRVVALQAWAKHAGTNLSRAVDPRSPRAPSRAEVLPYQLAPAVAIASGASRILLADEVGLGKTIQAGWIAADLLRREPDARILAAVPAGLRDQWASELSRFFDLEPARVDARWLRAAVADRPADVSPWAAPGVYLGSIDFLKRGDIAASLAEVMWDLLIVDEAHTATAPTDRYAVLARVAARSRRLVIVTATPFSGDSAGFTSMIALGSRPGDDGPLLFRRSRADVGDTRRRRHRFVTIRIGRAEFRLQRLIERYSRAVWRQAGVDSEGARLAMTVLRKRALSSPAAAWRSLTRRRDLLRETAPAARQLTLFDEEAESDEALPDSALATPGLPDRGLEARWLSALVEAAERAAADDSKARLLHRLLARTSAEPVVIFTEYRDTLRQLAASLPGALQLHGGLTAAERSVVQRRFNADGGVLIATDAAAEGLNLQQRCRLLVNYELPWNPARLEQRIGRIDRIGQRRTVHAVSLVARDTAEDLVVATLSRRLARVAATLGEHDRLASFLTDARTARAVIGGASLDVSDGSAVPPLPRAANLDYPVDQIARSLLMAAKTAEPPPSPIVSCFRARGAVPPGCIAIVRTAAVAGGVVIAERPLVVHVADTDTHRPPTRAAARERAARVIRTVERAAPLIAGVREWFADARAVHRASIEARSAREAWLRDGEQPAHALQPGLFDRRAEMELEQRLGAAQQRAREHERHLLALQAMLDIRLDCIVTAVLLGWR